MDKSLAINYVNYFAGINYGMTMYSRSFPAIGNFAAGLTYLNYGSFKETDESGNITGTFTAAEYALSLIYSRNIDSLFTIGANLKPVLSHLEKYTSFGIALDVGASYHSRNKLFSAGLVIKNAGFQITSYAGEAREKLPFEIQAGVSQRLAHAPFRFSLTLRHLEKFDLTYDYEQPGQYDWYSLLQTNLISQKTFSGIWLLVQNLFLIRISISLPAIITREEESFRLSQRFQQ